MKKHLKIKKLSKFLILVLVLIAYTALMISKYGLENGPLVSLTTWAFFVFCTPIADAGFLIDFPVRIITGLKMIYSEIIVWVVAFMITIIGLTFNPSIFETTGILKIYHNIITNLFPYGVIIILSAIGTFLSIYFGDEIYDKVTKHTKLKKHHKKYIFIILVVLVIICYYLVIKNFNIDISIL